MPDAQAINGLQLLPSHVLFDDCFDFLLHFINFEQHFILVTIGWLLNTGCIVRNALSIKNMKAVSFTDSNIIYFPGAYIIIATPVNTTKAPMTSYLSGLKLSTFHAHNKAIIINTPPYVADALAKFEV